MWPERRAALTSALPDLAGCQAAWLPCCLAACLAWLSALLLFWLLLLCVCRVSSSSSSYAQRESFGDANAAEAAVTVTASTARLVLT